MKEMDREGRIAFENRTIALIGERKRCRHFYLQFQSRLDIKYCFPVSINEESSSLDSFFVESQEVTCMPFNEGVIRDNHLLLILCCRHRLRRSYDTLLLNRGFEWGEDYIDYLYAVHYYQKCDHVILPEKNLWIFGAGNNGKTFYQRYKQVYHICGFISNFQEEQEFQGLPVIKPTKLLEQENFYVVICSEAEPIMSRELLDMGLVGGANYGFADMLPKKLLVAMGTCQITYTVKVLYKNIQFSSQYNAGIYLDSIYQTCSDADNKRLKGYGNLCDVVFYNITNAGSDEQRNYKPMIDKFYKKADRIFMPFYYFTGQLMQVTHTENNYLSKIHDLLIWMRGDKEINQMVESGLLEQEILEKISKDNYWTKEEIRNHFDRELKKIAILDRFASFPIKGFIEKNYKKMIVFDDGVHFSIDLHLYLANEIAGYLHLEPICDQKMLENIRRWQTSMMPVYPCVREALGMDAEDTYRFYCVERNETEYLSFEEYAKRYIQYINSVREIFRSSGTTFRY